MTEKPDLTVLPHAELVKQAIRTGGVQYRTLDELARRVRKRPSEWTETGFAPYEIELAFLHLSQSANETDGEFACSQDARIRELERRADLNESRVTEFMNCVVAELRKVEIVKLITSRALRNWRRTRGSMRRSMRPWTRWRSPSASVTWVARNGKATYDENQDSSIKSARSRRAAHCSGVSGGSPIGILPERYSVR